MPKPEIIGSVRSTYTRVVRMVCEEKGIEYLLTERPLGAPEIFAIHPFGNDPALRTTASLLTITEARHLTSSNARIARRSSTPQLGSCGRCDFDTHRKRSKRPLRRARWIGNARCLAPRFRSERVCAGAGFGFPPGLRLQD